MTTPTDAPTPELLAEIDALIEIQARLQFAKENYSDHEANAYGIRLLDFMRTRGLELREAIAAWNTRAEGISRVEGGGDVNFALLLDSREDGNGGAMNLKFGTRISQGGQTTQYMHALNEDGTEAVLIPFQEDSL